MIDPSKQRVCFTRYMHVALAANITAIRQCKRDVLNAVTK